MWRWFCRLGHRAYEHYAFCPECGMALQQRIPWTCKACGHITHIWHWRFCRECGVERGKP